ncbi:hypothetical protein D9756_005222 [Leucocoprinus leucothites]|uniref:Uncharacterized protein n=1 Tax=Leucocoprinus leucothites TaxID=201217 RepID=A0A8H5DA03_9AGAR|nr:hypothetical protein D9756_005222 [Leucoagaricus leucothites]
MMIEWIIMSAIDTRFLAILFPSAFFATLSAAYLTNPSESTFRAYLTEQSFRQYLSRLDENCDDAATKLREGASRMASSRGTNPVTSHILPIDGTSPFHFANRASVSLRTPKHVFHSFGIFTVAAMIPLPKPSMHDDRNRLMISDSWYIGAFGKWWRGGILETWYQDVISRSKDEESWSSGILSMKSLDMLQDFAGPVAKLGLSGNFANGSPPKLRNRERPTVRNAAVAPRNSSPPPLPKSASLPLHTTRVLPTASERPLTAISHPLPAQPQQQNNATEPKAVVGTSIPSRSPSTLFDQSPRIAQLLEQISTSKSSLVDLRAQLLDYQTSASQTHALLQEEVNSHRERKRIEDAGKLGTKSRMRALEDSKRSAESVKRDADKRLKSAQAAHDHATQRIQSLDKETVALQEQTVADEEMVRKGVEEVSSAEREIVEELELKKQEIKDAEDIVTALNQRARELEDELEEEREKLRNKKHSIETRKAKRSQAQARISSWSPSQNGFMDSGNGSLELNGQPQFDGFAPYRHSHLTVNTLSAFDPTSFPVEESAMARPSYDGYAHSVHGLNGFADEVSRSFGLSVASPTGQSLIPSGLITSLDGPESIATSRSFQSDTDPYVEKEWRSKHNPGHEGLEVSRTYDPFYASPVSLTNPSFPSSKRSSLDGHGYTYSNESTEDMEFGRRGPWSTGSHGDDSLNSHSSDGDSLEGSVNAQRKASACRWFPTLPKDKSRKGLNPDAKEFNMLSSKGPTHHSVPSFDNLNPTGLGSSMLPSSSTSATATARTSDSLFLRAFAPSPAEREALQRALGGANTSFERLPSLSDVGSIPSSPSHIHALPHAPTTQANKLQLPSWLSAFPRGRKTQFSPWGDEELSSSNSSSSKP